MHQPHSPVTTRSKMDATNTGSNSPHHTQTFLLRVVLLLTLSAVRCQGQLDPEYCHFTHGNEIARFHCVEITNFSAVSTAICKILTNVNSDNIQIRIELSPHLVLKREDFDDPAYDRLVTLILSSENRMTNFSSEPLRGLKGLKDFEISRNAITSITSSTLSGLSSLETVYMYFNEIASIQPDAFKDLGNLSMLSLRHNELTTLEESTFQGLVKLRSLDLSCNKIMKIDSGTFQTLRFLDLLKLQRNSYNLESLDSATFQNNPLRRLDLSDNNCENLGNVTLNISTLQHFRLKRCNIGTIPEDFFINLPHIRTLSLKENKISSIEPSLFAPLRNLQILEIDGNQLTSLTAASFAPLRGIVIERYAYPETYRERRYWVTVGANPWDCTTPDMQSIRAWFGQNVNGSSNTFDEMFSCNQTRTTM